MSKVSQPLRSAIKEVPGKDYDVIANEKRKTTDEMTKTKGTYTLLEQILRDMYVDPDILAALDETYKQKLFCRMREEQIRRWRIWDEQEHKNERNLMHHKEDNKIESSKHVTFRLGLDGEPWVWVMGEHPNDLTIEEILDEEAKQKARELAESEFRKSVEAFSDYIDCDPIKNFDNDNIEAPKIEDMEIYCSVDELRERSKAQSNTTLATFKEIQNNYNNRVVNVNLSNTCKTEKIDVLQEITNNKSVQKVSARIAQWEQRAIGQRTSEIFKQMQKKKQEVVKEAEEAAKKEEEFWREQERKAKQAEIQMREIARRAREEHRKSMSENQPNAASQPNSLDPKLPRPPNQDAVMQWYKKVEFPKKAGLDCTGRPAKWFHGLLTRTEAEHLLSKEDQGTFLVRITEKIWGYAISYKDVDRCKHYLVDASSVKYQFLGQNQREHNSLGDLIRYHSDVPITSLGNELLQRPCPPKVEIPAVFVGLLQ